METCCIDDAYEEKKRSKKVPQNNYQLESYGVGILLSRIYVLLVTEIWESQKNIRIRD